MAAFEAFELALDAIRQLRAPLAAISRHHPPLAEQVRRAAASVALDLSEGNRRRGRDRLHLWRIAAGSAAEVIAALRVAEAWGHVDEVAIAPAIGRRDEIPAITWTLTR